VAGKPALLRRQDFLRRPDSKGGEQVPVPDCSKIALGHLGYLDGETFQKNREDVKK
jgi:hypothetical protein